MVNIRNFGVGFLGKSDIHELLQYAKKAEEIGFGTCWIAEDYFYGGAYTVATACAAATSTLGIGIGVINPYTRHPALIAMETAALSSFSNNRAILGLGMSNPLWIQENMGIPFKKPLDSIRDTIEIIRGMLSGDTVSYEGKVHSANNVHLELPKSEMIPIYLGVKSEKAIRLAGEQADGILLSAGTSAPYVAWVKEQLLDSSMKANRSLDKFDIAAYLLISIDENRSKARDALKNQLARYIGLHGNHPIMLKAGLEPAEIEPMREAFLQGAEGGHLVSEKMIDTLAIAGTPEECQMRLKEIIDAGVTQPILFEVPEIPMYENMKNVRDVLFPIL